MGRCRERGQPIKLLAIGHQIDATSNLGNAVVHCVEQPQVHPVPKILQVLGNLACQVTSSIAQDVWDILQEQSQRLKFLNVAQVLSVELPPCIPLKSFGVVMNLPQLRPANAGIGLAGGTPDDHVDC